MTFRSTTEDMMHGRILSAALAAVALIAVPHAAAAADTGDPAPQATEHPLLERAVAQEVNRVREHRDLPPLRQHDALERAAKHQSRYLVRGTALRHESADGEQFWTRLVGAGYPRQSRMAENLALMPSCRGAVDENARAVVRMWMESPGHRANLLDGHLRHLGVSATSAGGCHRTTIYTADFGG